MDTIKSQVALNSDSVATEEEKNRESVWDIAK